MKPYIPRDWYWFVGSDRSQAFSSARAAYVPVADAAFVAWKADGTRPTVIDTEANLWDVLLAQFPAGVPAGNATAQGQVKDRQLSGADMVALRIAFNHENRIRALEGKASVTMPQFTAAVKALL